MERQPAEPGQQQADRGGISGVEPDLCPGPAGFLLLALLLALANRGTPFFRQTRPGRGGRLFRIVKFKTMTDARDSRGELLSDEQRLTRAGALVRSLSLDELPQLFNVLAGQMSFIGPRPLLPEYLPLYTAEQARRHDVRPGITGWAQVNGRNAISWERKFELDVWYVDHLNFLLDMRIIFLTLAKVVRRQGISAEGCATMQKFTGSGK
ncbi:sugar transferase [Akkermansia sp.]|uniref:sugar transferase n=3 Tax=Akkermansia sp. TaxID=1872421 RepID=UPI003AB5AFFD